MASWEEYKKKHGIQSSKQEQSAFDGGAAWEQYKKDNNISSDNTDWRETLYQRDQAKQKAAAERRQDKNALRAQKNYLDNFVGPNPIGGKETAQANYYSNLAAYGSKWGDAAALDEGFARYQQALASVDDAYQQEISRNKKQDIMYDVASSLNPFQTERTATRQFEAAGKRYARDAQLYSQMAQAANQAGSNALWEKAAAGDARSREAYSKAVEQYGAAYSKYHPAEYYAQTMTKDELQSELDRMNALDEKYKAWTQKEARTGGYYGSLADVANDLTSAKIRDEKFNQKSAGKLQEIENEIGDRDSFYEKKASLEQALKFLEEQEKTTKYEEVTNAFLSKGPQENTIAYTSGGEDLEYNYVNPLTKEAQALAEKGRAAYENDQKSGAHYTDGDRFGGGGGKASAEGVDLAKFIGEQRTKNTAKTFAELGPEEGELEQWQRDIFYALYAKDPEAAWDWLAIAQERADEEYYNRISDYYSKGLSRIYGLPFAAGLSLASGISPYSEKGQKMSKTAEAITRGGAQAIQEKGILNTGLLSGTIAESVPIIGGKGLGDLYQLAESMVQSGALAVATSAAGDYGTSVGAAVEFLGTVAMGRGAAASDYRESLARGMEKEQAMLHATAAGIAEAAFEYISLDKLVKTDISKGFWKNVLTQGGVEASEELCTTLANRLSDGILARQNGYDTQIEQRTKELIALGASRKDAEAQAEKEWIVDLINDGLGGFISGGFMSAGNTLANWNAYKATMEDYGSGVTEAENAALQAYAADNGIRLESIQRQAQDEAQTEQQAEEALKSTRETRKEKKENRKIGEALTKVVDSIEQKVSDAGLQSAERVYSDTVQLYGADISNAAEAAVVRVATRDFAEAYNSSAETARTAYDEAMQATKSEPVRQAIREAWEGVTKRAALLGDKVAAQEAIIGAGNGKMLNLGAEIATKDGETQQVQITALGAKRGTVRLDNGSVVELDALQGLDADTKDVIDRLDAFDLGSARSMAFQAYRLAVAKGEVTDGVRWVMSYALAYEQGRIGAISLQEAIRRSSLPDDVVTDAYKLGAEQTETWRKKKEDENAKKRAAAKDGATGRKGNLDSGRVSQEKMDALSADKQDAIRTMELLAEATGVDIRLIAQKANAKGNVTGYQGKYSAEGNYIEIDINAGLNNIYKDIHTGMTAVLGHELTHWMQENAPTEYLAYKKAVLQAIMSTKNGEMRLERMIEAQINQNKREGKEITRSEAEDEVVADASMKRMGDTEFWDAVADNLGEKKADVAARIIDYISKFFQRVREIIGQASHTSEAARIVDQAEAEVQTTLRRLYAEGIGAAMRNSAQIVRDAETLGASEQMLEDATVQYSSRIDDETLHFLDNQEHVTVYRAMQVIDGKLYPPMAAKVEGKLVEPTEIGKWYQSVERPDLVKDGKFTLNKGNGTSVPAAYNPYFHCSASPLNDQFSSAYKRPNLVVVEGIIPKSELTSGYRAEGAKNTVGETTWHAGPVASKLKGDKARRVFLSRWFQVQRIMTDAEVAGIVAKTLEGENVSVPSNVVTPGLLEALRSEGVQIDETGIQRQSRKNAATKGGEKLATRETTNGQTVVVLDGDILSGINLSVWDKPTKDAVKKVTKKELLNYSPSIFINNIGKESKANKHFRDEYTRSDYSEALSRKNPIAYADKMRMAKNVNEVYNSVDTWKNDGYLKHPRTDDLVDFMRGKTLVQAGTAQYEVEAVIGIDKNGEFQTQDIVDVTPTSFTLKSGTSTAVSQNNPANAIQGNPASGNKIAQEASSVKPSDEILSTRSDTDSTGRELSEGQQEYFKDSRARDINGKLLVLYHQTENDFTVFDPRHEGSGTRDQQTPFGIFLKSSDRDIGVKGKKQMALYANITKPLVALNRESLESKLRDLSPEYAKLSDQHKAIDREYKQKHEQSKQAFTDHLTTWREQHPNAGRSEIYKDADFDRLWNAEDDIIDEWEQKARKLETETKEVLTNALEAAGYDGIFLGNDTGSWGRSTDAYIALHPEQVKNVDNLNPTEKPDIRFSTRDYSDMSDLDLAISAANEISEGGGEDYWASLLESNPGLANEAEEIKRLGKQLKKTEGELAEARRNLTLTDRKLKTRGISTLAATIMQDQKAGDINNKNVKNRIVAVLTEAYQKALDKLDAGGDFSDAWEIVYYEGAEKATDILMQDATHAEKIGYKWYTNTLGEFLGEGGRGYVAADIASRLAVDFEMNRYRPGQKGTIADRLVEQAENRLNKKLSEAKTKTETLQAENTKLQEEKEFYKSQAEQSKDTAGFLYKQLLDEREALKNNKKLSDDERKKTLKRLDNLEKQMKAKRREAQIWKDKAQIGWKAANKAIQEKQAAVDKLEKQLQRERDILSGKLKPPAIQSMLKAAREREAARVTQHKDEAFARYKERKNETALRNRIKNLHKEMNRDLLKPREGHFVPQGLIRSVVDLLDMVNTQTTRAKSESAKAKIDAINATYDRIKRDERYSQYYDETVKAMLTELSATLEGRSIYDLSYAELEDVYTVMKAMRTTIRNTIKADLIEKGKEVWEIGNALRKELRASKGASPLLFEKYHMAMLSAERAFHRFGGYMPNSAWDKVYRMLDNAQLKMLTLEMQATRLFDPVLKEKADFKQAEALTSYDKKDLVDIGLKDENGNTVPITRGMMLALYMHLQNEENMRHLMYGGLTLPDFRRYYKGQENAWGRGSVSIPALGARVSNLNALLDTIGEDGVAERYKAEQDAMREMWESVRQAIEEKLSPYDKKWIEASKKFFDDFSRRELNRVTNEMYGFSKAKVDNYFPIVTDRNFLKTEFDSISRDISLENAGFMKERVKAGNPILLEDITRAVNRQISNVSRYAGLTQALKTFGNVYNVQLKGYTDSVKKAMSETFEDTGKKYIENLITDMIGGRTQPGSIFDRVKGNYAQAVLSANLSVTVKQAASFPTAAATVGWKPLMKALVKGGRNRRVISRADRALIDTYSPLLWKRSQGAIDTEIGDMAHAQDWTKKAKWLMGWIEKTDIATVGRLWYAAEYYVQENYDLQKGSEAQIKNGESPFYQKVAEVFNRIVEDTQPNYTVLQRPDILRNPNKLVRAMTMFSTQRFQNANILIDAAGEYNAMRRYNKQSNTAESKAALKASKQKLTHAISSQTVSAVLLNVMTLVAGAILHRMNPWRDDDDELTQESILEECANEFFSTVAGSFLGGAELYEAISSILTGSKYYGNDVGGISTINDFVTAVVQFGQKAVKLIGDEESKPEDWTKLAENQLAKVGQYLAQMTGVPVANINKIIAGGKNHIIDMINGEFGTFEAGLDRSTALNASRYYKAWTAGDEEKLDAVLDDLVKSTGGDEDKIRNAVNRVFKNAYDDKEISRDAYTDFIQTSGLFDNEQQSKKIRELAREALKSGEMTKAETIAYLISSGVYAEDDAWKKTTEWEAKAEHEDEEEYSYTQYESFFEGINSGMSIEQAGVEYLEHGYTQEQLTKAAKTHIGELYTTDAINKDQAMKMLETAGMSSNDAWAKLQEWDYKETHEDDESYSKYDPIDDLIANNKEIKALVSDMIAHGEDAEKVNKHIKDTLVSAYVDGKSSETKLKNQLSRYLGIIGAEADEIAEDADKKIRYNKLIAANPNLDVVESVVNTWYDKAPENYGKTMKQAGIPLEIFADYAEKASKAAGVDADGDGKTDSGSKKKAILQIIDGLNLTSSQKDALYYLNGYAASKLYEAPWH